MAEFLDPLIRSWRCGAVVAVFVHEKYVAGHGAYDGFESHAPIKDIDEAFKRHVLLGGIEYFSGLRDGGLEAGEFCAGRG